ncbi:hypothetical protein N7522_003869 [Penicillium canescens]|nr:hypothetical protein N7522_003869 [Penicillium canescens]
MASDDVMNDTSDNDPDGELDSLASSGDSDQDEDKSYYVETIYMERVFESQTQYLVKWADYPAERATWEPVNMFDDEEETLEDWERKKKDIASGKQQPFDFESWERHCAAINEFREDRRQRREKRISGVSSSRGLVDPRKPTHEPKTPPLATKAAPSTRVISQNIAPTPKKSGANQPLPKRGLQTSDAPIGQADKSPYASLTKAVDSRTKRRRLEIPREPPAPAIQTPRPAPSGFATGGRAAKAGYRSHHFGERAPDVTKLDLMRPSQYSERTGRADIDLSTLSFTTGLNSPPPPGRTARRSGPSLPTEDSVKSSSGPRAQTIRDRLGLSRSRRSLDQGDNRPSSAYSRRDSPTRPRARSRSPDLSLVAKRSNATVVVENSRVDARAASPADSRPGPPSTGDHSTESQLAQLPRRTPAPNSRVPNSTDPRLRAPNSDDLSMESQLTQMPRRIPGPNACKISNGLWFNPKEALMTMSFGPDKKFIGSTRVCGMPAESRDLTRNKPPGDRELQVYFEHLCTTSEFAQLHQPTPSEQFKPTVVRSTGWIEGFNGTNSQLLQMAEHLRENELVAIYYPQHGGRFAYVASSRYSQNPQWSSWIRKGHISDAPSGVPILLTACENLLPIVALGPRRCRDLLLPVRAGGQDQSTSISPKGDLDVSVRGTDDLATALANALREHITKARLNPDDLAIIDENGKISRAGKFYLHFPLDNQEAILDLEYIKAVYVEQGVIIFTNQTPNHWASFVNDPNQGVAIFHESFLEYESLQPPIALVNKKTFSFWIVRVSRPLEMIAPGFPDPESTVSGSYAQRIFPQGTGMILLTEDVMSNLLEVAITLRWIYRRHRGKPRYWKLVFFPGILEWIKRRLNDEVYLEDHDILLLIHSLIVKNNLVSDTQVFNASSLEFFSCLENETSTVLALPPLHYGSLTENDLAIKDKSEHDAGHLIEILAGVAKLSMARFRNFSAITSERYKISASKKRWDEWGHITINYGFKKFYERFKVDRAAILAEINASHRSPNPTPRPTTQSAGDFPQSPHALKDASRRAH